MKSLIIAALAMFAANAGSGLDLYTDTAAGDWATDDCNVDNNDRLSPMNFDTSNMVTGNADKYNFCFESMDKDVSTKTTDTGATIKVEGTFGAFQSKVMGGDDLTYNGAQFHFHAPAEHTIDDKQYDLEMHIVQMLDESEESNGNDGAAVMGFFFEIGDENPFFDASKGGINVPEACATDSCGSSDEMTLNLKDFGFDVTEAYFYQGSLTTPPCSPIVSFFLSTKIMTISQAQLDEFKALWINNDNFADNTNKNTNVGNNRPVVDTITPTLVKMSCDNGASLLQLSVAMMVFLVLLF